MKKIFVIIISLFLPSFCYAQPAISFNKITHDFGIVSQKEKPEHTFQFTNKGDQDLIIEKVSPS